MVALVTLYERGNEQHTLILQGLLTEKKDDGFRQDTPKETKSTPDSAA
jgi:hypothetical protein